MGRSIPIAQRFKARVDRDGPGGCWLWTGGKFNRGYGAINVTRSKGDKYTAKAHRVSYELFVGPIPPGMLVCHRCDNPPCVNPAHLFLGTPRDNMVDMCAKGRHAKVDRRGAATRRNKLTESDVITMRARSARGESSATIAAAFGVNRNTAWAAIAGRSWSNVV